MTLTNLSNFSPVYSTKTKSNETETNNRTNDAMGSGYRELEQCRNKKPDARAYNSEIVFVKSKGAK